MIPLREQHLKAAEATRGISADFLYEIHEQIMTNYGLTGDVLDFGAGLGILSRRLLASKRFSSVTAADILPKPVGLPEAIQWITGDLEEPLEHPEKSFDVIIACEVISCFENPRALAREWFRLLRPGGKLLLSTPNALSFRNLLSLMVQAHFVDFGPRSYPFQKTALVPLDLQRIYTEAGFEQPSVLFSNRGSLPRKPAQTWQDFSAGILKGRWFSDHVFIIGRKPD